MLVFFSLFFSLSKHADTCASRLTPTLLLRGRQQIDTRMGGLISRICCCGKSKQADYKKLDQPSPGREMDDIEAGGGDDDEDWGDNWGTGQNSSAAQGGAGAQGMQPAEPPEPEPEPESDPFADFGMTPTVVKTKRHVAQSVWAQPAAPTSSSLLMMESTDAAAGGGGWGDDDDLGETLGVNAKRRAAEQRRLEREKQRDRRGDGGGREKPRLAATKVVE